MLSENDIQQILKAKHYIYLDNESYDCFVENFNYDDFEVIATVDEKEKELTRKEWEQLIEHNKDCSGLLAIIASSKYCPPELFKDVAKSFTILDDTITEYDRVAIGNEEAVFKKLFEADLDEKYINSIINNLPPFTLANIFYRISPKNIDIETYKKTYAQTQKVLKIACEKAINNQPALSPNSFASTHNLDMLTDIDDFDYLKNLLNRHFEHKKTYQFTEGYIPLLDKNARLAMFHNIYLDINNEEHVEFMHQAFYNQVGYKNTPLSDISLSLLKRTTPYIIDRSVDYFVQEIKKGEDSAEFSGTIQCLLENNFLTNYNVLYLFDVIKDNYMEHTELLKTLLSCSDNNVLLDFMPNLPFELQTVILMLRNKAPNDIYLNYFKLFVKEMKKQLEDGELKTVNLKPNLSAVLGKCLTNVKMSNADYEFFFNEIDKSANVLYSVTSNENAIPDHILTKLIQRERTRSNDETNVPYKTPQLIIQMLTNLCSRQTDLPKVILDEFYKTHHSHHACKTLKEYERTGSLFAFAFDNINSAVVSQFNNAVRKLNISKEECIKLSNDVADRFKKISDSITGAPALPHEKSFADFFVLHMENMYDLGVLGEKRQKGDFDDLSKEEMKIVFKSFSNFFPEELENPYENSNSGDFDYYLDDCITFNEEGQLYLKAVERMKILEKQEKENENEQGNKKKINEHIQETPNDDFDL